VTPTIVATLAYLTGWQCFRHVFFHKLTSEIPLTFGAYPVFAPTFVWLDRILGTADEHNLGAKAARTAGTNLVNPTKT